MTIQQELLANKMMCKVHCDHRSFSVMGISVDDISIIPEQDYFYIFFELNHYGLTEKFGRIQYDVSFKWKNQFNGNIYDMEKGFSTDDPFLKDAVRKTPFRQCVIVKEKIPVKPEDFISLSFWAYSAKELED